MTEKPTNSDAKSKKPSAADAFSTASPDHDRIAHRAHELWRQRGGRQGFAERDWFDAEEELRAKTNSQNTRNPRSESGTVQR
jgi:hypothetical protein